MTRRAAKVHESGNGRSTAATDDVRAHAAADLSALHTLLREFRDSLGYRQRLEEPTLLDPVPTSRATAPSLPPIGPMGQRRARPCERQHRNATDRTWLRAFGTRTSRRRLHELTTSRYHFTSTQAASLTVEPAAASATPDAPAPLLIEQQRCHRGRPHSAPHVSLRLIYGDLGSNESPQNLAPQNLADSVDATIETAAPATRPPAEQRETVTARRGVTDAGGADERERSFCGIDSRPSTLLPAAPLFWALGLLLLLLALERVLPHLL